MKNSGPKTYILRGPGGVSVVFNIPLTIPQKIILPNSSLFSPFLIDFGLFEMPQFFPLRFSWSFLEFPTSVGRTTLCFFFTPTE